MKLREVEPTAASTLGAATDRNMSKLLITLRTNRTVRNESGPCIAIPHPRVFRCRLNILTTRDASRQKCVKATQLTSYAKLLRLSRPTRLNLPRRLRCRALQRNLLGRFCTDLVRLFAVQPTTLISVLGGHRLPTNGTVRQRFFKPFHALGGNVGPIKAAMD